MQQNPDVGKEREPIAEDSSARAEQLFARGLRSHRDGALIDARTAYEAALQFDAGHVQAIHHLGILALQDAGHHAALDLFARAIALDGGVAVIHANRAYALAAVGRLPEALESYEVAIGLDPRIPAFRLDRGNVLLDLGRPAEALASFEGALALEPGNPVALNACGNALLALDRPDAALVAFEQAMVRNSRDPLPLLNRAIACAQLRQPEEVLKTCGRVRDLGAATAQVHRLEGNALLDLGRPGEAVGALAQALAMDPEDIRAWQNHGVALLAIRQPLRALQSFDEGLALCKRRLDEENKTALIINRLTALQELGRSDEARQEFERLAELAPHHEYVLGLAFEQRQAAADWRNYESTVRALVESVERGIVQRPFSFIGVSDSPGEQLRCAQLFARNSIGLPAAPWTAVPRFRSGPIRLGYFSGDYYDHAMARVTAGLFHRHDRSRFEIFGFSAGPDDGSALRSRLQRGFDHFVDVHDRSDQDIVDTIAAAGVDILVDLNGYTMGGRPAVFARRPAPVQVSYLGYPGTLGGDWMDYLIADAAIIPPEARQFYSESVVWLPDCYQINDDARPHPPVTPSRAELGIPDGVFVFACFNSTYKITPPMFDVWMRILRATPDSVLWLVHERPETVGRLRSEAHRRGVDPQRLCFAAKVDSAAFLARIPAADLFLDTLPYNAHGTASDALWMGLPVLTCPGRSFASRVASSLLNSVRLPGLVAKDLLDYERIAVMLAQSPQALERIRAHLAATRTDCVLFDTARQCRNLEAAFEFIWERHCQGLAPAPFSVPAGRHLCPGQSVALDAN